MEWRRWAAVGVVKDGLVVLGALSLSKVSALGSR